MKLQLNLSHQIKSIFRKKFEQYIQVFNKIITHTHIHTHTTHTHTHTHTKSHSIKHNKIKTENYIG